MKRLLWKVNLGLFGLAGVIIGAWIIVSTFARPAPWWAGALLVGYSIALIGLSGYLIWVAIWGKR